MDKYILVVDDDEDLRDLICQRLRQQGLPTLAAANPHDAIALLNEREIVALVTDHDLKSDLTGLDLCRTVRTIANETVCIVVSGSKLSPTSIAAAGASALFEKPCDVAALAGFIVKACPLLRMHLDA